MSDNRPPGLPEPTALPRPLVAVMSSGFFGFFAHAGFLQALADLGVEPDAYAGSSSGALVAALAAAGQSPQEMLAGFTTLKASDFWDPPRGAGLVKALASGFRGRTGYLSGQAMRDILAERLPYATFEQCPHPCLVVALDVASGERVVFTEGPLVTAVAASGAVPGLFAAVPWKDSLLVDGGLVDKAPLAAAHTHLGAACLVTHLLTSASLEKPLNGMLSRAFSPLRLQSRAVDAARLQHYRDQLQTVRQAGATVLEVTANGLPRLGPRRLQNGPQAFAQARRQSRERLQAILRPPGS
jgi:NTE family protein